MKEPGSKFGIITTALNCTQDQLATCIGITRALLSYVEIGKRQMPDKAELRLLDIYQLILTEPLPVEPPVNPAGNDMDQLRFEWQQQVTRQPRP